MRNDLGQSASSSMTVPRRTGGCFSVARSPAGTNTCAARHATVLIASGVSSDRPMVSHSSGPSSPSFKVTRKTALHPLDSVTARPKIHELGVRDRWLWARDLVSKLHRRGFTAPVDGSRKQQIDCVPVKRRSLPWRAESQLHVDWRNATTATGCLENLPSPALGTSSRPAVLHVGAGRRNGSPSSECQFIRVRQCGSQR